MTEKRNLPFDVRKMYCQSADEVRKIVKKYEDIKETSALLA